MFYPFVGVLTNEGFLDFVNNGYIKSFDDYCINGNNKELIDRKRMYVVGKVEIQKENKVVK